MKGERNPRYDGRPLLRLVELYTLWAIERLPSGAESSLDVMTPNLRRLYGLEGDWRQVVAGVMRFPPDLPEQIRGLWLKNTEIARKHGTSLDPQKFAEMFVDENFPIDPAR